MGAAIVGRDDQLAQGVSFLDEVKTGLAALVFEGASGIGKTVLWQALVDQAVQRGFAVVSCRAERAEARLSLVGLADLLAGVGDEVLAGLPAPQRDGLEVALLRRPPSAGIVEPRTVGAGLRTVLAGLASAAPLLVAIDDVQWLDAATVRAVGFAARRLDGLTVRLLMTERTPSQDPDPLRLERSLGVQRSVVRLGPLSLAALQLLFDRHLEWVYTRSILVRIAEASGGNPLFALEIARSLGPAPSIGPGDPLPVPDSLRELVAGRLEALAPGPRGALLAAAALSHPSVGLVERASSADDLEGAEEAGIVRVERDRVLFGHPLFASAIYSSASRLRRRELHGRLAKVVLDPEERARHLALAASEPDEHVAATLEDAAARARSRGAPDAAAELLRLAIALTADSKPDERQRRCLLAAEDHLYAGDRTSAHQLLEDLIDELPEGPILAAALRLLAQMHVDGGDFQTARRLLDQGLAEAVDDHRLAASIQLDLAWVLCQCGDAREAAPLTRAVLDWAQPIGDRQLLSVALAGDVWINAMLGNGVDEAKLERALSLEDSSTRAFRGVRPSFTAAWGFLITGNLARAGACASWLHEQLIVRGEEEGLPSLAWVAVAVACASGDLIEAARIGEEAVAAATMSETLSTGVPLLARAMASAHLGHVEKARADAAAASAIFGAGNGYEPHLRTVLGFAALSEGDASAAHDVLSPLADFVFANGLGEPYFPAFLPDEIEALISLGDFARAGRLNDLLAHRGEVLDRPWALATAARGRGLLLMANGDLQAAERAIEGALREQQRLQMPFELARTMLVQGRIRRRGRRKRAAGESLERACRLFEGMGAQLWSSQAHAELERLGLRRESDRLTVTERRVAELAASGMTAREIAGSLFVSPRTVESNLERIYRKLGVSSRAELGARMATEKGRLGG